MYYVLICETESKKKNRKNEIEKKNQNSITEIIIHGNLYDTLIH